MNISKWILFIIGIAVLSSCVSYKRVALFQDAPITETEKLLTDTSLSPKLITIQAFDVLSIKIGTAKQGFDKLFQSDAPNASQMIGGSDASNYFSGNYVNADGNVNLPILGQINLLGKTIPEAESIILSKSKDLLTDPFVEIKFANFKIEVLGESVKQGSYVIANEKTDIIECLASSGGLNDNADPKNILLIRSRGEKKFYFKLDLTSISIINSPAYKLEPHDVIVINSMPRKFVRSNLLAFTPAVLLINTSLTLITFFFLRNR